MIKKLKLRKLKIAEQIILVLFIAVIAPMTISAIIVNNVNQHAVRAQLQNTALLIANMISDEIDFFDSTVNGELNQLNTQLKYLPRYKEEAFLNDVLKQSTLFEEAFIVSSKEDFDKIDKENLTKHIITIGLPTYDGRYLGVTFKVDQVKSNLFRSMEEERRQIYVIGKDNELIASHNYTQDVFTKSIKLLPKKLKVDEAVIYEGMRSARNKGRFEPVGKNPVYILDGAHNEAGMEGFVRTVKTDLGTDKKFLIVVGILKDKDVAKMMEHLGTVDGDFIATEPNNPRKLTKGEMGDVLKKAGRNVILEASPVESLAYVKENDKHYDAVLFVGSLYLIGEIRRLLDVR